VSWRLRWLSRGWWWLSIGGSGEKSNWPCPVELRSVSCGGGCCYTAVGKPKRRLSPLVSVTSAAWTSALFGLPEDFVDLQDRALAGQADLRDDPATQTCGGWGRWTGCGIPPASLKGYHTPARGQSRATRAPVPSRAAPGLARGRAPPGRGDATQPQRPRPSVITASR
jgi:hypothetical protein